MEKITDNNMNRDLSAAYLSIIPGLGHMYKHHWGMGICWLLATPLVLFATALLAAATFGIALIAVPAGWWGWIAFDAYHAEDWSHHRKGVPVPES